MDNSKTSILIVEDDSNLLQTLSDLFSKDFDIVLTACDGVSAYIAITENSKKPDLIFSDIRMPGWNGLEFVSRLRAEGYDIPVIFASGEAEKSDLVVALKLGAVDYIQKPYEFDDIKSAIFRVLEISKCESKLNELIKKYGENSEEVQKKRRIIGLSKVINAEKSVK